MSEYHKPDLHIVRESPEKKGKINYKEIVAKSSNPRAFNDLAGDLSDTAYQAERDAARVALAELPDGDRILAFDSYRARILALPDAIAAASGARREELCRIVVERVVVRDRQLETIDWTPPARPFFEKHRECPQGDSNP